MNESLAKHYLEDSLASFRAYKKLAEKALAQLSKDEFFITLDEEANSIGVIMKHMAGNMFSRWTDFLTTDGEKPDRNRDMEFVIEPETDKENILTHWEKGWQRVFDTLESLSSADLEKKVTIRGKEHTVVQAINRQLMHYSYHIGQMVFLAKHFRSSEWKSLSIPRNKSLAFNKYLGEQKGAADTDHRIIEVNHVNVTVPAALEQEAKHFYGTVLGLRQIPKPEGTRQYVGAWFDLGGIQLHLSIEDNVQNEASERHVCYQVADAAKAELHFRDAGVEIISDKRPVKGTSRFFLRDPGGNMIEITEGPSPRFADS